MSSRSSASVTWAFIASRGLPTSNRPAANGSASTRSSTASSCDRVGQLDLAALARRRPRERVEDRGREHVAADHREARRRVLGRRLLDDRRDAHQVAVASRPARRSRTSRSRGRPPPSRRSPSRPSARRRRPCRAGAAPRDGSGRRPTGPRTGRRPPPRPARRRGRDPSPRSGRPNGPPRPSRRGRARARASSRAPPARPRARAPARSARSRSSCPGPMHDDHVVAPRGQRLLDHELDRGGVDDRQQTLRQHLRRREEPRPQARGRDHGGAHAHRARSLARGPGSPPVDCPGHAHLRVPLPCLRARLRHRPEDER